MHNQSGKPPTGNAKPLVVIVAVLTVCGLMLARSATLPSIQKPNDTPSVAADVTQEAPPEEPLQTPPPQATQSEQAKIIDVVDGDTVKAKTANGTYTVRLIGVDTPETKDPRKRVQCYGQQASSYTESVLSNANVTLQPDPTQQNYDKYNRLLRYIFLADGTLFNQQLIANGYAYEYTYQNNAHKYQAEFRQAMQQAQQQQKGLWSPQTCNGQR